MLPSGSLLGSYEILAKLGEGGMGEVYRARDSKLNRLVAIKAMHATMTLDQDRVSRFEREAQLLASLNHSNIAAIHGLETVEGTTYLVLEFVDGRTLSDVVRHGPLPFAEALAIARQIADALAATHERGIIHRDLKPGNVMVTPEGHVKVLDFGLGKSLETESTADRTNSPTMTLAATQAGIILGTAGYMSPEQAKGRNADKRSDVWAFGCVLYEMLTGRRAFDGEDITETLAAIVRGEPDWTALPGDTPAAIRTLIERSLVKNRAERLSDMSVVRFLLNEPSAIGTAPAVPAVSTRGRVIGWPVAAAIAAVALLAGAGGMRFWSSSPPVAGSADPATLTIALPEGQSLGDVRYRPLAISRDGRNIAYVGVRDGSAQLYIRGLNDSAPRALDGTAGASGPFFSHDGEWIAFFAQGQLKKISTTGAGLTVMTTEAPGSRGGAWAANDIIYFAPDQFSGIVSMTASGGALTPVTTLDAATEVSHRWPVLLPDGQTLLFTSWRGPGPDERQAAVQSLTEQGHHVLLAGADTAQYVNGHLLYGKGDSLFAVPFQPGHTDLGRAVPAPQPVHPRIESESVLYAVSERGTMVFVQGDPARRQHRVVWVERDGRATALPLSLDEYVSAAISPDGLRAVIQTMRGVETLWIYDFASNILTPLTSTDASSQAAVWADNEHVIYRGTRAGTRNLYRLRADGTGVEERLTTGAGLVQTPTSVSRDGQWLAFTQGGAGASGDVMALKLTGDHSPRPLVQTPGLESNGHISPNGRWLAFRSERSGKSEVYVQPFPDPGPAKQISIGGGREPRWSRNGSELFYEGLSGDRLMVVDVGVGTSLVVGPPRLQSEGVYRGTTNGNTPYDISLDGKRFLRIQPTKPDGPITRLEVLLNWTPKAAR